MSSTPNLSSSSEEQGLQITIQVMENLYDVPSWKTSTLLSDYTTK